MTVVHLMNLLAAGFDKKRMDPTAAIDSGRHQTFHFLISFSRVFNLLVSVHRKLGV